MTYVIDWAAQAAAVPSEAGIEAAWNAAVARDIGRDTDRFVVDAGCGSGGMTRALADAWPEARVLGVDASEHMLERAAEQAAGHPRIEFVQASYEDGFAGAVGRPADLVWASASVHHAGDQQGAVTGLAELLAPGGQLALAEGGLPAYYLPWDVGVGEPGLEHRLVAAGQRWFERMRAALPGQVRMPYGWPEAMRRAGLTEGRTRTFLTEVPAPLPTEAREVVVHALSAQVERLADTELLDESDRDAWRRLLDPDDADWVGGRDDTYVLRARSVYLGRR